MSMLPRLALSLLILAAGWLCPSTSAQGFLCLEGGGSFGVGEWDTDVVDWCMSKAPSNPDVLIIGTFGSDGGITNAFLDAGAFSANTIAPTGSLANQASTAAAIANAEIIWVRDSLAWFMIQNWEGTLVEDGLRDHYLAGGVLGGSGSGAMIMGEFIFDSANGAFTPRDALENSDPPQLSLHHDFLGIAPSLLIDEDFTGEGRLPRLALMLARVATDFGVGALGLGIDDRTALGIHPDGTAVVLGEGSVTLLHALPETEVILEPGQPPAITDLRHLQMVAGYEVDLLSRAVLARPTQAILQGPPLSNPIFGNLNINGSVESHSAFGDVKVDLGLGFDSLFLGAMQTLDADNLMFRTVVSTNTWFDPLAYEVKVGGIQYALSQHPHFLGLLLDGNVRVRVTPDNTLIVREVVSGPLRAALLLDSYGVQSTAVSVAIAEPGMSLGPRQSVALDDARLHMLRPGDGYSAETHKPIMPDSQWLDVGQGLSGSQGLPELGGSGSLVAFNLLNATLRNAEAFSVAFLIIGFSEVGAPLKQGVLVPTPDFISQALPVNAEGSLEIDFLWPPAVPKGFDIYTQYWIQDSAAPAGFSASNGLVILPP